MLHFDVDQIRAQLPLALLADQLSPEQHTLIERTHAVIIAFDVAAQPGGSTEPAMAGVFVGDYDARINPLVLVGEYRQAEGTAPGREVWLGGGAVWIRTPQGYWLGGEPSLAARLFAAPERRKERLSSQPWSAPPREPYFASAAVHVTPPLQRALNATVESKDGGELLGVVAPALLEVRDLQVTLLPDGDGLRLRGRFDFSSELGAHSGELVLRGLLAILQTQAPELGGEDGTEDARAQALKQVMDAIAATQISTAGTRVSADIVFDGPQLSALMYLLEESQEQVAVPAYLPPSAEVLAERAKEARANPTFGKVLDRVIEIAGIDLELRDGRHPQSGKPRTPYLVVRSPAAPAHRQLLRDAFKGKRLQVVPIAREPIQNGPLELGIFGAPDEAAVLVALGTGEAREPGLSKRLAKLVRGWRKRAELTLAVATGSYLAVELTAVPADPDRYVSELVALCPGADAAALRAQLLERRLLDCSLPVAAIAGE